MVKVSGNLSYSGPVYNLEVEEDNSYTANSYAVHNCWKLGQCLLKFSNHEDCYYGHIYQKAKMEYVTKNENGLYAEQAKRDLESGKYRKKDYNDVDDVSDETDEGFKRAEFYLKQGKLPPAQIDARARRYAVKIFLSHLHQVWYEWHFKTPAPKPFALAILGHAHMIEPPSKIVETDKMIVT